MASLIASPSTYSLALIDRSYISNLCVCPVNFLGSRRQAFGLVDALVIIIDQRKVISSRWRYNSAYSSASVAWI
jgi:hypothetical protein